MCSRVRVGAAVPRGGVVEGRVVGVVRVEEVGAGKMVPTRGPRLVPWSSSSRSLSSSSSSRSRSSSTSSSSPSSRSSCRSSSSRRVDPL
ncbi:hypothetical protein CLOP_g17603 [Closterium sp. NIES-67]|nr:hypothetical protein CLOP_g17603 [Closterium sp. NIES-67]